MQGEEVTNDHDIDKLEIIRATHKAVIEIMQDPAAGQQGTTKERRVELRKDLAADALTCMEVALAYSQFHEGMFEVFSIANKLKSLYEPSSK